MLSIFHQVLDIQSEERLCTDQEVIDIQSRKTGALIRAACMLGVLAGGGSKEQLAAASEFASHLGLAFQIRDDILDVIGDAETLGKAVGSFGAFCVANNDIINYLVNKARSFIFSTSIPPINIAWTNWLLTEKRAYLEKQQTKLRILANKARELVDTTSESHIIPITIGSNENTIKIAEKLRSEGYYIPAIRPPTVKEGTSRLRISLTADSKIEDFEKVLKIIHESLF